MVGTIIWTIPKPDNNNENDYDHDYDHRQQASDEWHTRWMTPQGLNGLMAADDPMARRYDQRSLHLARRLDNAMDKCYNDEMSEKATMQIGR